MTTMSSSMWIEKMAMARLDWIAAAAVADAMARVVTMMATDRAIVLDMMMMKMMRMMMTMMTMMMMM